MPETRVVAVPEPRTLRRRRRVLSHLLALPLACLTAAPAARAAGLPDVPAGPGSPSARARLRESALAHGLDAWGQHHDLNASFSHTWSPASGWAAADADAEAGAAVQLRWLPGAGLLALSQGLGRDPSTATPLLLQRQARAGAAGPAAQPGLLPPPAQADAAPAALSADALWLLLLGPIAVLDRATAVNWGPPETLDGRRCDQLVLTLTPGLGLARESRMALFIDRDQGWLRRLRWAGDAPQADWWGVAEVDFFDHFSLQGMVWPRRFESPSRWWLLGAPAQQGRLTGLDLDRGYPAQALVGPRWTAEAAAPAKPLPPA